MIDRESVADRPAEIDEAFDELVCEVSAKLEGGEAVDLDAIAAVHPEHVERLGKLLPTLQAMAELGHSDTALLATSSESREATALKTGVLGDYRILREVGRGGMGVVYEAEQVSLGRKVALKVLPFAAMLDQKQLQRFQNEARAAASLRHPNIVQVHFVGCERAVHFYAMDYIEGQTLAELIRHLRGLEGPDGEAAQHAGKAVSKLADSLTSGRFYPPEASSDPNAPTAAYTQARTPGGEADTARVPQAAISTERSTKSPAYFRSIAEIGVQVAEALDHAHQNGVVHRDVKPSNVMLDNGGKPWVTDFGLARIETDATLTVSGDLLGTVRYMSPEQALAKRIVVDHRTDVYSLGATLYEMLTLQPVFTGQDRQELLRQIAFEEPKSPRKLNKAIPEELEIIVLKAMAKNPAERYDTAQDLADDLRRFLEDRPIRARRPTLVQRAAKWSRRHKPIVWSAAISTFLLLFAGLVGLSIGNVLITKERDAKDQALVAKDDALADKTAALKEKNDALVLAEASATRARENESKASDNAAKAAKNYEMARQAVQQMLTRVADEHLEKIPEMKEVRYRLLDDALAFYDELLKLNPVDAIAYHQRGWLHERRHEFDKARADYEKAIDLRPEVASFHTALAWLLCNRTDGAEVDLKCAILHAETAARLKPLEAGSHHDLAIVYGMSGDMHKARAEFLQASDLCPSGDGNNSMRARACSVIADFRGAVAWEKRSLHLQPDSALINQHLSWYYMDSGEYEQVIATTTKAIDGFPKHEGGRYGRWEIELYTNYFLRADAHARLKMYPQALEDYSKSLELAPLHLDNYRKRALVQFHLKHYDKALADIAAAVELKPDDATNLEWIPLQFVAKCPDDGFRQGMLALADKTIKLTDGAAAAYVTRARLYVAFGQPEKALADFNRSIELDPKNPGVWTARGEFCADQGQREKALADFEKAVQLKPDNANDCNNLARCLATCPDRHLWKPDLAVELAEKALRVGHEWNFLTEGLYWNTLGAAYYRAGQWKSAVKALNKAMELRAGGDAHEWFLLAMAHWQLGNHEDAREWYHKAVEWMAENEPEDDEIPRFHSEASELLDLPDTPPPHTGEAQPPRTTGPVTKEEASRSAEADEKTRLWERILEDLGKDSDLTTEDWALCKYRAEDYKVSKRWDAALLLYDKLIEWTPEKPNLWKERAEVYLSKGDHDKALADFSEAIALGINGYRPWYEFALFHLAAGNVAGYPEACRSMIEQFGETDDPTAANFVAWTCALAPDAIDDYEPVLACATKAIEARPDSDQFLNTLGAILYRAGRHGEAIERLMELDRRQETADGAVQSSPAYTWYFLAMAHQKAGNVEQAREYLNKANQSTDEEFADKENPPAWNRRATLELLRKEAEALLGADDPKSAKNDQKSEGEEK